MLMMSRSGETSKDLIMIKTDTSTGVSSRRCTGQTYNKWRKNKEEAETIEMVEIEETEAEAGAGAEAIAEITQTLTKNMNSMMACHLL